MRVNLSLVFFDELRHEVKSYAEALGLFVVDAEQAFEGLENLGYVFLGHTAAVVGHGNTGEGGVGIEVEAVGVLDQFELEADEALVGGVFYRVDYQVADNLFDLVAVVC